MAGEDAETAEGGSSGSTAKKSTAKKSTAKKSAAKKSAAKKSPAKKSPAKKSPAKKSAARKSAATSSTTSARSRSGGSAPRASSGPRPGATQIAASAAQQLLELTGREAEGITGLDRNDDGWTVQVEVVEVRRIPDTTDLLALYEVETDEGGELQGYRRVKRYSRGSATEE